MTRPTKPISHALIATALLLPAAALLLPAAALLLPAAASVAHAGAWTQARGGGFLKLSYGTASANDQFGFDGQVRPIVDGINDYPFADRSVYFYGEYGITDRITLIGSAPFKRIYVHDRLFRYHTTGLGDLGLGARWRAWARGPWVGSLAGLVTVPTGYHRQTEPPLGPGHFDLTGAIEVGRSLYPLPGYLAAALGFRYRTPLKFSKDAGNAGTGASVTASPHDYADQIVYQMEAGWSFARRVHVNGQFRGVQALRTDENAFSITSIPTSERYLKAGGGAAVDVLPRLALTAELFATPIGRNTARSVDVSLGVATTW